MNKSHECHPFNTQMMEHCLSNEVQFKEARIMKDVFFAVTIFHSIAAVVLFSVMAVTVVHMISNRIQPKG
jgi:uncharacterized membrane protein YozB (DUF420 family)